MQSPWPSMICRQFAAAIQTIRQAVDACPDRLWDDRSDGTPFWHLAYHALFFVDLYLSDDEKTFQATDFHEDKAQFLPGDYRQYAGIVGTPENAFRKDQLLGYADHCMRKCNDTFEKITDERALERCGFWWYKLNVGEFLLNNLRHAQHHAGQLAVILRRRADIGIDWIGTKDNQPPPPTW
ncbi:MAG TPA: DinB family protein [Acidobacteriota bacterium]|nr:DinB family protein [Acidobacteriota bacterium]